jgi:hypothetical protein
VETEDKIDLDRLRVPEPMLFFDEVVLFEDELADNGDSFLSAKVVRPPHPCNSTAPSIMEWGLTIVIIAFTLVVIVIVIVLSRAQRAVQRVMPSYFYVLLRLYMRVDDVMMRIYEYARSPHVLLLLLCVVHRCGAH